MTLRDAAATYAAGRTIGRCLTVGDVVTLSGPLGAGKTTLARGAIDEVGLVGEVASPTFPIVIAYEPPDVRVPVAHVDLYRIERPDQLDELGLDALREVSALLIEWPEHAPPFTGALALTLSVEPDGSRRLTAVVPPGWTTRWPPR